MLQEGHSFIITTNYCHKYTIDVLKDLLSTMKMDVIKSHGQINYMATVTNFHKNLSDKSLLDWIVLYINIMHYAYMFLIQIHL